MSNLSQDLIRIGLEQGIEQGVKKGLELGQKQGTIKTIISFINAGISKEEIYIITKADDSIKEEVEKIINNKDNDYINY